MSINYFDKFTSWTLNEYFYSRIFFKNTSFADFCCFWHRIKQWHCLHCSLQTYRFQTTSFACFHVHHFCNHCNWFMNQKVTFHPKWPHMTFDSTPGGVTCATLQVPLKYIWEYGYSNHFFKTFGLTKRLMTPTWPLTPLLLQAHVQLYQKRALVCLSPMDDIKMWIQWPSFKNVSFTKRSMTPNDPKVTFDPISVKVTCATLPKDYSIHT